MCANVFRGHAAGAANDWAAVADAHERDGLEVAVGGFAVELAEEGEIGSEAIAFVAAAFILLLTFGSVVAAGLPLTVALAGLGVSAMLTGLIAALVDVPDWTTALATMLGIALGIDYTLPVASAQVKSALLLAGLYAKGDTVVREPHPTRDYTERMLAAFGWPIGFSPGYAKLAGGARLRATDVNVPADFSSAAFFLVAASIVAQVPIHRFARPEEIASAVLYLASDESAYVVGTELIIAGGMGEGLPESAPREVAEADGKLRRAA